MGPPLPLECPLGLSSAKLMYGRPPSLPGQFLSTPELPPSQFLWPIVPRAPSSGPVHLLTALWEVEYAFVCWDGLRPSLTPLYDGLYKVVLCSSPFFRLAINDREDSVWVSCFTPFLASRPIQPALP